MSLTLFPITALLLLLSGMSTPMHAAGCGKALAALGKQISGAARESSVQTPVRHAYRYSTGASRIRTAARVCMGGCDLAKSRPYGMGRGLFTRKQYRTRFGFAEGAYLALGPPVTRFAADLG